MRKIIAIIFMVQILISCSKTSENIAELTAPIVYAMAKNLAKQEKYSGEMSIKVIYNNISIDEVDEWPRGEIKFFIEFSEYKGKVATIQYILDGTPYATAIINIPGRNQKQVKVNLYENAIIFGQAQTVESKLKNLSQTLSKNLAQNSKIAIFEFVDLKGNNTLLGKRISESLITHLSQKNYQIVERKLLDPIFKELSFQQSGLNDTTSDEVRNRIGKFLGADYILIGTMKVEKEEILINSRIVNIQNGIIISSAQTIFPKYLVNFNDLKTIQ